MTGFREKEKGLLRKKGKVAQPVDNSAGCVDNLLTGRRAFTDSIAILPGKDCAFTPVKRQENENLRFYAPILAQPCGCVSACGGSAREKERVLSGSALFLSIYRLRFLGVLPC